MEVQNKNLGPWIVFQQGKRKRRHTFFNMAIGSYRVRNIRQMLKKDVWLSCHGWLLLRDLSGKFCLFNPVSQTEFEVPQLTKRYGECVCVLSAPPTDSNSQLFLITNDAPIFYFCTINADNKFTEAKFNLFNDGDHFCSAVSCKGKTYFLTDQSDFGEINVDPGGRVATPTFLNVERPNFFGWHNIVNFLVESCGEVFLVCQNFLGTSNWVIDFIVFKMDFSQMRWVHVKSIGDRLFFLSESCSQSCSAFESGLEGDQIFFFLSDDKSLYSFHMKERSISVDFICPNVQPPWKCPFWVLQTNDEVKADMEKMRQSNVNIKLDMERIQLTNANEKVDGINLAEEIAIGKIPIDVRPWSDLAIEIVMLIATRLTPVGYAHMRSICKSWRSIIPPAWLPDTPCLIFREEMDGFCKFFDPLSKRVYAADIPELHGATFHFSRGCWLLVSLGFCIFCFNPFTKERINLPDLEHLYSTISFSSVPTSPDCVVFTVFNCYPFDNIAINTCSPGAQRWSRHLRSEGAALFRVGPTNPVFHNGCFYCLGRQGDLGVYNVSEDSWNVLKITMPIQFPLGRWFMGRCFLIKSKGELLFVYYRRNQIHVFTLEQSKLVWVEDEGVEGLTLFLSRTSSIARIVDKEATAAAIRDMKNKICISRFHRDTNDALFYSMESKSHHLDFYNSKEFMDCTWIEPMGLEFKLDSQCNILNVTNRFR